MRFFLSTTFDNISLLDINIQLEKSGLKVKNCDGAIVDATVIESSARPRKVVKIVAEG